MKKTFEEKIRSKIHQAKKKKLFMRFFRIAYYRFVLMFYYIGMFFSGNAKRFIVATSALMIFCLSTSFVEMSHDVGTSYAYALQQNGEKPDSDLELIEEEKIQVDTISVDEDEIDGYEKEQLKNLDESDRFSVDDILENNEYEEKEHVVATAETYADYEFDKNDWRLLLINKQHPVPDGYEVELGNIYSGKGNMKCDARILDDLMNMLQAAKEDGVYLQVCSPYRDYAYQELLFERKIDLYMGAGYSYMEAYKRGSQVVTVPGASEHQLGLALDIVSNTYTSLDQRFGDTDAGKWLYEHSREYGFILRYPKDKEYITSIEFEPWHFRYVGVEAATIIMDQGITLEEFVERLE